MDIRLTLKVTLDEAAGGLCHDGGEPLQLCGRKCLLPVPGRCAAPARMRNGSRPSFIPTPPPTNGACGRSMITCAVISAFDFPTQFHPSAAVFRHADGALFPDARRRSQGLYAGVASSSSELVAWHTELRPGYGSSIDHRVPGGVEHRRERCCHPLRRGACALHPARRDARADPHRAAALPGRLAARRGYL